MKRPRRRRSHIRYGKRRLVPVIVISFALVCAGGGMLLARAGNSYMIKEKNEHLAEIYYQETPSVSQSATPKPAPSPSAPSEAAAQPMLTPVQRTAVYISSTFTGEINGRFQALLDQNSDTVGWLTIDGVLDYPVVQKNNTFYLTHDFYQSSSSEGAIFLDEHYVLSPPNENLLLHGHNMKDGSMFGRLTRYKTYDYVKKHPIIRFNSLYEDGSYVVYAVISAATKGDQAKDFYSHRSFSSDEAFMDYIHLITQNALFPPRVDLVPADRLLTLSTCDGVNTDQRIVIVARMIRPDETEAALRRLF